MKINFDLQRFYTNPDEDYINSIDFEAIERANKLREEKRKRFEKKMEPYEFNRFNCNKIELDGKSLNEVFLEIRRK